MKTVVIFICIALFLRKCQSQNTTSDEMGSGVTDTTESPPVMCSAEILEVNNSVVHEDVFNCSDYTAGNYSITVYFSEAEAGDVATANVTCTTTCDGSGSKREIGVMRCGADGKWSQPAWTDCSKTQTEQSPTDQLNNALTDTLNPEDTTPEEAQNAVDAIGAVSGENDISPETADDVVLVLNNLLQAPDAQNTVKENSADLLNSVNDLSNNIQLVDGSYEQSESNVAMAFVGSSSDSSVAAKQTGSGPIYYYGIDGPWPDSLDLASVELGTSTLTGGHVRAQWSGDDNQRLSIQIYSQVDGIFGSNTGFTKDVVYAVNGSSSSGFTMQFEIEDDTITVNETTGNKFSVSGTNYALNCVRWVGSAWTNESSCNDTYSAGNGFASCTCETPGVYSMQQIRMTEEAEPEPEPEDTGLSGGAIAGIVIGSVAGVALICGGVYYFMNKSKKSSSPSVSY